MLTVKQRQKNCRCDKTTYQQTAKGRPQGAGRLQRKDENKIKRESEAMAKGAALGVVAGAAAGMAGAYLASENKTEIKKFVKKAEKTASKALDQFDEMRRMHY